MFRKRAADPMTPERLQALCTVLKENHVRKAEFDGMKFELGDPPPVVNVTKLDSNGLPETLSDLIPGGMRPFG